MSEKSTQFLYNICSSSLIGAGKKDQILTRIWFFCRSYPDSGFPRVSDPDPVFMVGMIWVGHFFYKDQILIRLGLLLESEPDSIFLK